MSKAKHKHTNNLDELLEHLQKGTDDLDAFEKEALEGFAILNTKEEALDLKKELDARMEQEILQTAAKPKTIRLYWAAAAGLFLLIGFIAMFKYMGTANKQELAENHDSKNIIRPPADLAPVEMQAANEQEASALENDKGSNNQVRRITERSDVVSGKSESAPQLPEEEGMALNEDVAALPPASKAELKDADEIAGTKAAPAKDAMGGAMAVSENKNIYKSAEKEREESKADKISSAKAKKSNTEAQAPASAAEMMADEKVKQEPAGSTAAKLTVSEKELKEKLDVFMKNKSYRQSFSCVLKISSANEIKDVTFLNSKQFSRKEEKDIIQFLKELKCFQTPQGSNVSYYTLNYQLP